MTSLLAESDKPASLERQVLEARDCLASGDAERALALLAPLADATPPHLPAQFLLSMTAWRLGRLDWSIELMRQCHEAFPMDGTVAEILASLYAQAGDLRESLFMGKLATALGGPGALSHLIPKGFPTFDWAFYHIKSNPMLGDAKALATQGESGAALEKARQHAALNPRDGAAHGFYASLLLRYGLASGAVSVLRAVERRTELPAPYASLYARALTQVGDFDAARRWHERAIALASNDAEIAAARVQDSLWLDDGADRCAALAQDWARRFCPAAKTRDWQRPRKKLVIGYLISRCSDPLDLMAVAAVARAHDRSRATVIAYAEGAQSWEANVGLAGSFDIWQDIRTLNPATLARFFLRDGLDLAIDAGGFATPDNLLALARLNTALRVSWFGNTGGIESPIYDALIVAPSVPESGDPARRISATYPLWRPAKRPGTRIGHEGVNFGADVSMAQLDPDTVGRWSGVLDAVPTAKLVLRANDMDPGDNIDRLVARFGRERAARIDVLANEGIEAFYAQIDVALLPRRGVSPRAAADAVACGVPPLAVDGAGNDQPYASFLRDLGLGARLVAADDAEFLSIAAGLATPEIRDRLAADLASAAMDSAAGLACVLEDYAFRALDEPLGVRS
jgi:Flp pilus assembly protein TadD